MRERMFQVHNTREAWLKDFSNQVGREVMSMVGECDESPSIRLSCGFGPANGKRKSTGAVLMAPECSADDTAELFVSPELSDTRIVARTILPLVIQAWLGDWTNTVTPRVLNHLRITDSTLPTWVIELVDRVGNYPHAKFTCPSRRKDSTRLIKVVCAINPSDYVVRMSRKCLNMGAPMCPCHNERMVNA